MRVFSLVFMILGCFLGAGFVSGKEVASYFSVFGKYSLVGVVVLGLTIFLLLVFFLNLSSKVNGFNDFVRKYFGKNSDIINFLFAITMLIFVGSMIAGNYVFADYFKISKLYLTCTTLILVFFIVSGKDKSLAIINNFLIPIVILVLLCLSLRTKLSVGGEASLITSIFSATNYGLINIVPLGVFIIDINKDKKMTKKGIFLVAMCVTLIIIILLFAYNNAIIVLGLENSEMPILDMISSSNFVVKIVVLLSLYLAMFTTIVSCVFTLSNYINNCVKSYKRSTMLALVFGLIVSFFGFDTIVNYVYSIIAVIGLFIVVSVIIKERNLKKSSFSNTNC